jgi:hypothetical protein
VGKPLAQPPAIGHQPGWTLTFGINWANGWSAWHRLQSFDPERLLTRHCFDCGAGWEIRYPVQSSHDSQAVQPVFSSTGTRLRHRDIVSVRQK